MGGIFCIYPDVRPCGIGEIQYLSLTALLDYQCVLVFTLLFPEQTVLRTLLGEIAISSRVCLFIMRLRTRVSTQVQFSWLFLIAVEEP